MMFSRFRHSLADRPGCHAALRILVRNFPCVTSRLGRLARFPTACVTMRRDRPRSMPRETVCAAPPMALPGRRPPRSARGGSAAGHAPVPNGAPVDQGRAHSPGDMRCDPRSPQVGNLCQIISLVGARRRAPGRAGGVTVDHVHRRPPHGAATGACETRLDDHPAAVFDEGIRQSAAPVPGDVLEGLASSSVMCPNWPEE